MQAPFPPWLWIKETTLHANTVSSLADCVLLCECGSETEPSLGFAAYRLSSLDVRLAVSRCPRREKANLAQMTQPAARHLARFPSTQHAQPEHVGLSCQCMCHCLLKVLSSHSDPDRNAIVSDQRSLQATDETWPCFGHATVLRHRPVREGETHAAHQRYQSRRAPPPREAGTSSCIWSTSTVHTFSWCALLVPRSTPTPRL